MVRRSDTADGSLPELPVAGPGFDRRRPGRVVTWLLGLAAVVLITFLVEEARVRRGSLPAAVVAGREPVWRDAQGWRAVLRDPSWVRLAAPAQAAAAGLLALVVALGLQRRRAGAFGAVAAAALAAAAASWLHGVLPAAVAPWTLPAAVGVVSGLSAPLCADRGMLRLAVVSLVLGGVCALARGRALDEARRAGELGRLRTAVLDLGLQRVMVAVPDTMPLGLRQALALSVVPPLCEERVELACVEQDSAEQLRLQAEGWQGVRLGEGRPQALAAGHRPEDARWPFEVAVRWLQARGPVVVVRPAEGHFVLRVATPAGVVRQVGEDPVHGLRLDAGGVARLRELTDVLGAGTALWVTVDEELFPAGAGWTRLVVPAGGWDESG